MADLCRHIAALVQNAYEAKSTNVSIFIYERSKDDRLEIIVTDNGRGIKPNQLKSVGNPFFTTKPGASVGLGLSLLKFSAEQSGGSFYISSLPGYGCSVRAVFSLSNINREPLGDISSLISQLIISYPEISFIFEHGNSLRRFYCDIGQLDKKFRRYALPRSHTAKYIHTYIKKNEKTLKYCK